MIKPGDSIPLGPCENCGEMIYWQPDDTSEYKLREIADELENSCRRRRVEVYEEQPKKIHRGRRGVWMWSNEIHYLTFAAYAVAVVIFLVTDDIKWHALVPVGVLAFWIFSHWLNYATDKDIVRMQKERRREDT